MTVNRKKRRSLRLLWGVFFLALATLACESDAAVDVIGGVISTPTLAVEATSENKDPNYVLSLPQQVKSSNGWTFTIHRVEILASLDTPDQVYLPQRGLYLWLAGTVGNLTGQHSCVRGQEFRLWNGSEQYQMSAEYAEAARKIYNMAYPDSFLGYCLDTEQTVESFLIFDTPKETGQLWLELGDGRIQLGQMSALIQVMPQATQAAPEAKPKSIITAGPSNVNIRSGPDVQYPIIGVLLPGQSLEIVGRNADSSWWQVITPNGLGWVAARVTTASNVDDNIPIATP